MLRNYLTVALRVLVRQRLYAFINITGLALGIACCLLMAILVAHEWSYDRFHERRDRIFRLVSVELRPGGTLDRLTLFAPEIPAALAEAVPGVELATGYSRSGARLAVGQREFRARVALAGPAFLRVFSFPLLAGDPVTALARPDGIVVTESLADKLFGRMDGGPGSLLGRTITAADREMDFVVTGVAANLPQTASIEFSALIPIEHRERFGGSNRGDASIAVYLQVADNQTANRVESALRSFMPPGLSEYVADLRSWEALAEGEDAFALRLQPLTDVYWDADTASYYEAQGNRTGVQTLAVIAVIILLLACSNFTTLSAALSSRRAREVGMRKVLGAARAQVMHQFWGEALLIGGISLIAGLELAGLLLPMFSDLVAVELSLAALGNGSVLLLLAAIIGAAVLLSGSHVSLVLSRLRPVATMRGGEQVSGGGGVVRALVIVQYAVSIGLLICTGVMLHQLDFVRSKNLGYDKEHVVVVQTSGQSIATRYKEALLHQPRVAGVTLTDRAFTTGSSSRMIMRPDGEKIGVRLMRIDPEYLPTLGIDLVSGRNFSADRAADEVNAVLINETLGRRLGGDDPTGRPLEGYTWWDQAQSPTIVGVVRDFHIDGLQEKIKPLMLHMHTFFNYPCVVVKLTPGDLPSAVETLGDTWNAIAPGADPIRLSFLDANLEDQYRGERYWQRVVGYASAIAISISCLGLFGLASLSVVRRTREVAIRKVIGASVHGLVGLISRQFIVMLAVANVGAWPIAYMLAQRWLEGFAYRVEPSPPIFLGCGVAVATLALATTSVHTIAAALRNPVDALRSE